MRDPEKSSSMFYTDDGLRIQLSIPRPITISINYNLNRADWTGFYRIQAAIDTGLGRSHATLEGEGQPARVPSP